jgi:anaerobic selenocysteine-containing dehydrogenase
LQPNPGTDAAIAMAMMQQMIAAGRHDADFVQQWCTGFDALAERVAPFTPEHAASLTGVSAADIADVIAKVREVLPESHRRHIVPQRFGRCPVTTGAFRLDRVSDLVILDERFVAGAAKPRTIF